jgi:hypothetical protein
MKFELSDIIENPLTKEEEHSLGPMLDTLKSNTDQKIIITFEDDETPALARKKVKYLATRMNLPIRFKTKAGTLSILPDKPPEKPKPTRITRVEVAARILAIFEAAPEGAYTKHELAQRTHLTAKQIGNALSVMVEQATLSMDGQGVKAVYTWTRN